MDPTETPPPEGYRPTVAIIREWIQKYVPKPIRFLGLTIARIVSARYSSRLLDPPPRARVDWENLRGAEQQKLGQTSPPLKRAASSNPSGPKKKKSGRRYPKAGYRVARRRPKTKEPTQDIFPLAVTRAATFTRRTVPTPLGWLLAAVFFSAIGGWIWSPLWTGAFDQLNGGQWVSDTRRGIHMSGGEGQALGLVALAFALWSWVRVFRTSWSALRGPKK